METREEQVRNFVAERLTYKDSRVVTLLKEAAVLGMTWADAHLKSQWFSVKDRLPKGEDNPDEYNAPHRARSSSDVIITDGTIINRGYYSYARMRWEWNGGEVKVTHWMPIIGIGDEQR